MAILAVAASCLGAQGAARAEQATCKDVYQIYQTCYDGGRQVGPEGCGYLIEALGPRLLGEDGLSGFSAALTVGICKQACSDGAGGKSAMSMSSFRREFCGSGLK
ncbi:hypothetical protein [Desulfocurvus sp. DL9XJH121]